MPEQNINSIIALSLANKIISFAYAVSNGHEFISILVAILLAEPIKIIFRDSYGAMKDLIRKYFDAKIVSTRAFFNTIYFVIFIWVYIMHDELPYIERIILSDVIPFCMLFICAIAVGFIASFFFFPLDLIRLIVGVKPIFKRIERSINKKIKASKNSDSAPY